MTAMTEVTENGLMAGAEESKESVTAVGKGEISLLEDFENTLKISQDVGLTERAASEESDTGEKLEQDDLQQYGPTVCSPAADPSSAGSKWEVGAQCQAVWSEDGLVYPATVLSVDGDYCTVRFHGYGNEEDMALSSLMSPSTVLQTQENCQHWKPGSRCRAVYSEDGLVYPAVVLWVKGQHCCVRFDHYNNEEDQDISSLLSPEELHGTTKGGRKTSSTSSNSDGKRRRRREESQAERGGERRLAGRDGQQNCSWVKEIADHQIKVEREAEEKKRDEAGHSFSVFPPFPPPPQSGSGQDPLSFVPPPPPPLWMFGEKVSNVAASVDTTSSMLMLWYMCGFHTGSYMAQQLFKSNSKD
ncbi:survival of motor neuron protein-like isoform X2 [Anabas testudineus]|uniref:survival of motor neuron protein-like isoform X2 n=1 Tax=Anabas testudineus TaxID=64144 RepID=UPI000E453CAE|nr:survival of motor neuron protein-like isoform X2 [Anabas testudineus]